MMWDESDKHKKVLLKTLANMFAGLKKNNTTDASLGMINNNAKYFFIQNNNPEEGNMMQKHWWFTEYISGRLIHGV